MLIDGWYCMVWYGMVWYGSLFVVRTIVVMSHVSCHCMSSFIMSLSTYDVQFALWFILKTEDYNTSYPQDANYDAREIII